MKHFIGFLQLTLVGLLTAGCITYCNRVTPPCPDPPPVENTCDCRCDCQEEPPGPDSYSMVLPESVCGVTICCNGCITNSDYSTSCK